MSLIFEEKVNKLLLNMVYGCVSQNMGSSEVEITLKFVL